MLDDVNDLGPGDCTPGARRVSMLVPAGIAKVVQNASPATLAMTTRGLRARDLAERSRTLASQLSLQQPATLRGEPADSTSEGAQSPPPLLPPFRADRPSRPSTPGVEGCASPSATLGRASRPQTQYTARELAGRSSILSPAQLPSRPSRPRTPARGNSSSPRARLVRPSTAPSRRQLSRPGPHLLSRAQSPPRGRKGEAAMRLRASPPAHRLPDSCNPGTTLPAVPTKLRPMPAFAASPAGHRLESAAPTARRCRRSSPPPAATRPRGRRVTVSATSRELGEPVCQRPIRRRSARFWIERARCMLAGGVASSKHCVCIDCACHQIGCNIFGE